MRTLEKRGIHALFPIQKHVFEPAMAGRDLIGRARTGSGKTLAFALPVIESLIKVPIGACCRRGALPNASNAGMLRAAHRCSHEVATVLERFGI